MDQNFSCPVKRTSSQSTAGVYPASQLADYASDLAQRQQVAHDAHHPHGFAGSIGKLKASAQALDAIGMFLTEKLQAGTVRKLQGESTLQQR